MKQVPVDAAREDLRDRLVRLGPELLADCLLDMSEYSEEVETAVGRLLAGPDERIKRFKSYLSGIRRGTRYIDWRESRAFAGHLTSILAELRGSGCDPRTGLELLAKFYETDETLFNRCDDSDGTIGDFFRVEVADLWADLASECEDKKWVLDLVEHLQTSDDYGVRHSLLECAPRYLATEQIRTLADRFWDRYEAERQPENDTDGTAHDGPRRLRSIDPARQWLGRVSTLAESIHDPVLFEKATVARHDGAVGGLSLDIARVYIESDAAEGALRWLEDSSDAGGYGALERDNLLFLAYGRLEKVAEQTVVARRIFDRYLSVESLDRLHRLVGGDREVLIEEAARRISAAPFSDSHASFLTQVGRSRQAAELVVERRNELDGRYYDELLELAEILEAGCYFLATVCIYRALLDAILKAARSKAYAHGADYFRKLGTLSRKVQDWEEVSSPEAYVAALRKAHGRKYSFWSRIEPR